MEKEELRKLAEGGNAEAQYELGLACLKRKVDEYGRLVLQGIDEYPSEDEYAEGIGWLERAAEAGNVKAQGKLGGYLSGITVKSSRGWNVWKKDEEKSLHWDMVAAKNGDKDAAWRLAEKYKDAEDLERAIYWYEQSGSYYRVAEIFDEEGRYGEAMKYYKMAFDNRSIDVDEGDYLDGCKEFVEEAWRICRDAGVIGSKEDKMYVDFDKRKEDYREALEYYEMALERFKMCLEADIRELKKKLSECEGKTGVEWVIDNRLFY